MCIFLLFSFFIPTELLCKTENKLLALTGATSKSWQLHADSPSDQFNSCSPGSTVSQDNTFIFFKDGTFELDHGSITSDPGCTDEGCCTDLVNLVGTWQFTNSKKGLRVIALYPKDNPSQEEKMVLFNATIEQLTDDVLIISQPGDETPAVRHTLEFHAKK